MAWDGLSRSGRAVAVCWLATVYAAAGAVLATAPAAPVVPADSAMARTGPGLRSVLLSALEPDAGVQPGGWQLDAPAFAPSPAAVKPKVGAVALRLGGTARAAGSKGDFGIGTVPAGAYRRLGVWVHLDGASNASSVGLQVSDDEGETLLATVPADWTGWRWVEFDLAGDAVRPAYEQKDKNGKVDAPVKGVRVAWFANGPGPSAIDVDALVATVEAPAVAGSRITADLSGGTWLEPGQPLAAQLVLTNPTETIQQATVEFSLQEDPALFSEPAPHPEHGTDHAVGARSWTESGGKRIEENSLTDGKDWTSAGTGWKGNHHVEALQFVDLGRARQITHLAYLSGDANWVWKVDVSASADGRTYEPVPSLQNVDLHKKWGRQSMPPIASPVQARYLRLRYHNDGQRSNVIRMPSALSVYDGVADETWEVRKTGRAIASATHTVDVPPRSFAVAALGNATPLPTGAYLLTARVRAGGHTQLIHRHAFVLPAPTKAVSPESRFGINAADASLAKLHRRLGIGWVRFENLKAPMVSPHPGVFRYDGSVGPWHVNHDAIVDAYRAEGLSVLPFLFQTPAYASSAAASVPEGRRYSYPPADNASFAEFCFQTVARYGSAAHPPAALKTPDKVSAKKQMSVYEVWNEPNLTAESWGPWVGTSDQYMELLRASSEAIKRADPAARVTNGGYAGIKVGTIDALRAHRYADGKRPLDFIDVLNVHYYSGQQAPETATIDTNVERDGAGGDGEQPTYEDDLRALVAWRDQHKPGLPIWLTETGYDTGGPRGMSEQLQAARLPRVVMMALAAGVEKVFVYRETGSDPSLHAASGLLNNDKSFKPSWFTYATLIRALDGVTTARRVPHPDPNVRVYIWTKGDNTVLSAWAADGTAPLGLDLGRCTLTDSFGGRNEVELTKATPLTIFPVYATGFADVKALERITGGAAR